VGADPELSSPRSRRSDSNRRPFAYKANALPAELLRRRFHGRATRVVCLGYGPADRSASLLRMEHPKSIGDRSTLAVMLALCDAGYGVLLPFGENTRYDLVIDHGGKLGRVQCKTGRLREGRIRFSACSSYVHHSQPKVTQRDYLGEIGYFAVYCPQTMGVYLIPVEDAAIRREGSLRVTPPRNGQRRRIRNAANYEIGLVSVSATKEPAASAGASGSCA
jgi:hypothetical protein